MDAAASLVSLIQFTITGLNIIYKAFASAKEGLDTVSVLVKSASDLLHVLERLQRSAVVRQSQDARLPELIKTCYADVTRMAKKLEDLEIKENDKIRIKLWRSAKAVAKEKEWRDFQARLQGYSSNLTTFIVIEDSDKIFDMSARVTSVHDELKALVTKCENIENQWSATEPGAAHNVGDLQLQSILNTVRQAIQDQLASQVINTSNNRQSVHTPDEVAINLPSTGCIDEVETSVDRLSDLVKRKHDHSGYMSGERKDIMRDIGFLVDDVKRLTAEVSKLKKQTVSLKDDGTQQNQGTFYYRELRFTPDAFSDLPLHAWKPESQSSQNQSFDMGSPFPHARVPHEHISYTREEIIHNSRALESFIAHDRIRRNIPVLKSVTMNRKTLRRLIQWSQINSGPQTLWLRGGYTPQRDAENSLTCLGLKIASFADAASIPVVSYFCQISGQGRDEQIKPAAAAAVAAMNSMLYALIRQLLHHLPSSIGRTIDFSEKRFQSMDGTEASWDAALAILSEVVPLISPPLFVILDGVQWLEHESTEKYLKMLWEGFRQWNCSVLIITSGVSLSLRDVITRVETLTDEDLRIGGPPEHLERQSERFWKG